MREAPVRWNLPLLVTSLCWGFNFVALKKLYATMPPNVVSLARFGLMYAVLFGICLATKRSLRYPKGKTVPILMLGFFSMGVYMVLFLEGMRGTTAAEGAIVLSTSPIFTLLGAVALRQETFRAGLLWGALLALAGVGLIVGTGAGDSHGTAWGNSMVMAAAVIWAGCALGTRSLVVDADPIRLLTLSMPGGLLALLPFGGADALRFDYGSMRLVDWLMLAHVSWLAGVLAFIGFFVGVKQIGAGPALVYQYLVPGLAVWFGWLVLGQGLAPLQFLGFAIVLGGVAWAQASAHKKARSAEQCLESS